MTNLYRQSSIISINTKENNNFGVTRRLDATNEEQFLKNGGNHFFHSQRVTESDEETKEQAVQYDDISAS